MSKSAKSDANTPSEPNSRLVCERQVLAEILADGSKFDRVADILTTADFSSRKHAAIFSHMSALAIENEPIDFATVSLREELTDDLMDVVQAVTHTENIIAHARALKAVALNSGCRSLLTEAIMGLDAGDDRLSIIGGLQTGLSKLEVSGTYEPVILSDIPDSQFERSNSMELGFSQIHDLRLEPGAMIVVAGRPSMGKSSFCFSVALNRAVDGTRVLVFSMEMPQRQVIHRLVSMYEHLELSRITDGEPEAKKRALDSKVRTLPVFIDDSSALTPAQMRARIRYAIRKYDIQLIIIDYLQLMRVENHQNQYESTTEISGSIKSMAKDFNLPVMVACQLNRALESKNEKEPTMSDLRGSGAIEQDADMVLFPFRPAVYDKSIAANPSEAHLIVGKNRQGNCGKPRRLRWSGSYTLFDCEGNGRHAK